jgi:hypothetical protein
MGIASALFLGKFIYNNRKHIANAAKKAANAITSALDTTLDKVDSIFKSALNPLIKEINANNVLWIMASPLMVSSASLSFWNKNKQNSPSKTKGSTAEAENSDKNKPGHS